MIPCGHFAVCLSMQIALRELRGNSLRACAILLLSGTNGELEAGIEYHVELSPDPARSRRQAPAALSATPESAEGMVGASVDHTDVVADLYK